MMQQKQQRPIAGIECGKHICACGLKHFTPSAALREAKLQSARSWFKRCSGQLHMVSVGMRGARISTGPSKLAGQLVDLTMLSGAGFTIHEREAARPCR